jgi:hypothetical protein
LVSAKLQRIEAVSDFCSEQHDDKYIRLFYKLYNLGETKFDLFASGALQTATVNASLFQKQQQQAT